MEVQQIGRYKILAELGHGTMGVVYKAVDPVLDRIVAVKTINLSIDQDARDEYEARFQQEAKAAGSLSHSAIVTIHDLGKTGDLVYMAMEFLDGRELSAMISAMQRLPVKQAISIAAQVAAGLGYAHQRGIVHRDIKPANIMVLKDGTAKITDFGIARMRASEVKTQTGMRLGSPKYMSPEHVLGKRVDHRGDIFSLGITLYEMLTGKAPFGGDSLEALMYQTVNTVPLPPSRINPDVPEMLDLILVKMLEKNPENRYQSALDLASDLKQCERHYGAITPADFDAAMGLHEPAPRLPGVASMAPQAATYPRHRHDDAAVDVPEIGSLGLSSIVDSFSATQRLAKEIGLSSEFNEYSTTIDLAGSASPPIAAAMTNPQPISVPRAAIPPRNAGSKISTRVASASVLNSREKLIAAAILGAALVAAGIIAFV